MRARPSRTPSTIAREARPLASARKPIPQASRSRRRLSTDGCTLVRPFVECGLPACCCDLAGVGGGTKRRLARKDACKNERKDRDARLGACHRGAQTTRAVGRPARVCPTMHRYQFVDCRWELGNPALGHELYLRGHIPGASFLDVDTDLSSAPGLRGRHPLPDVEQFARAAASAGIGAGVFVVAYGTMGGAERLWWLLRHFGHDDCAVLELDGWRGPLRSGEDEIEPERFEPHPRRGDTISADELA